MVSVLLDSKFGAFASGNPFFSPAIQLEETYSDSILDIELSTATTADTIAVDEFQYTVNDGQRWKSLNPVTTIEGTRTYSFSIALIREAPSLPPPHSLFLFNLRQISASAKILRFLTVHHKASHHLLSSSSKFSP